VTEAGLSSFNTSLCTASVYLVKPSSHTMYRNRMEAQAVARATSDTRRSASTYRYLLTFRPLALLIRNWALNLPSEMQTPIKASSKVVRCQSRQNMFHNQRNFILDQYTKIRIDTTFTTYNDSFSYYNDSLLVHKHRSLAPAYKYTEGMEYI